MIAHTMLAVTESKRAKAFYVKALAPLGYQKNMDFGESAGFTFDCHFAVAGFSLVG